MSLHVLQNGGQPHMSVKEVGENVFGGYLGFRQDLKEYARKHHLECICLDDEEWLTCTKLAKIAVWLQRANPKLDLKNFLALLRKQGAHLSARKLNQTYRIHVMYSQSYRCASCDEMLKPDCQLDHIVPLEDGGEDKVENLQALCVSCHSAKTYDHRIQQHPMFKNASITPTVNTSKYFEKYEYKN